MTTENRKPTIAELEAMLADDRQHRIIINPDGSITAQVDDAEPLPCGHPASLLVCSVESDYTFCELCEARSERDDALQMERHYKAKLSEVTDWLMGTGDISERQLIKGLWRILQLPNFREGVSSDAVSAESVHSGKQNTADKSELLPTQLPKEK